jgi:DNA-binding XRE family transcriptional regulator
MNRKEFSRIRRHLDKTQAEMARLLGSSLKTLQSYEQGWRNIPTHVERQALFLLVMKEGREKKVANCWEFKKCSSEMKEACPAWEFECGHLCWFINGTMCRGAAKKNWKAKMRVCRECELFRTLVPPL